MSGSQHNKSGSQQVPSKDVLLGTDFDPIIARIKRVVGVKTDVDLTKLLGIHPNSIRSARKRGNVPHKWLTKLALDYTFDLDWVLTGEGTPPGEVGDQRPNFCAIVKPLEPSIAVVEEIVELVETRLLEAGITLEPGQKAKAIGFLFRLWITDQKLAKDALEAFLPPKKESG